MTAHVYAGSTAAKPFPRSRTATKPAEADQPRISSLRNAATSANPQHRCRQFPTYTSRSRLWCSWAIAYWLAASSASSNCSRVGDPRAAFWSRIDTTAQSDWRFRIGKWVNTTDQDCRGAAKPVFHCALQCLYQLISNLRSDVMLSDQETEVGRGCFPIGTAVEVLKRDIHRQGSSPSEPNPISQNATSPETPNPGHQRR